MKRTSGFRKEDQSAVCVDGGGVGWGGRRAQSGSALQSERQLLWERGTKRSSWVTASWQSFTSVPSVRNFTLDISLEQHNETRLGALRPLVTTKPREKAPPTPPPGAIARRYADSRRRAKLYRYQQCCNPPPDLPVSFYSNTSRVTRSRNLYRVPPLARC